MLLRIPRPRSLSPSSLFSLGSSTSSRSASSSSSSPHLADQPHRIAIVGGGPAGFYAASRLLSLPGSSKLKVDLFELLPTPFGLARFGVAPDHPEVKNCEHKFEETARDSRFRYFGNVQVSGTSPTDSPPSKSPSSSSSTIVPNLSPSSLAVQIPLSSLRSHYSSVLLTYGASLDRPLSIPGEFTLQNVLSARSFVNWYNGHPYHSSLLSPLLNLSKIRHVSIIGQGNVALDVARILLKPLEELKEFDLPDYALEELNRSRVETVEIVGRRGILQLAGTTKELREMLNLKKIGFKGIDERVMKDAQKLVGRMGTEGRAKKRALGLLEKGSSSTTKEEAEKNWSLEFLKSPRELLPAGSSPNRDSSNSAVSFGSLIQPPQKVGSILYDLNELVPPRNSSDSSIDPSQFVAKSTGETQQVSTDMVFKSVGYRSIGLPGLPFDEKKGIVRNDQGRVINENGEIIKGLYTSGWLARGPNGVIATTMFNAFSTADLVALDLSSSCSEFASDGDVANMIESFRKDKKLVSWEEWEKIDKVEKERGREKGKLREKITSVEEMLSVL